MTTTLDQTTKESDTVNMCRDLFRRARNEKRTRYGSWTRNYRLVHNRYPNTSGTGPTPRDSEIYPVLSSLVAWMSDQKTNITVSPAADPQSNYAQQLMQTAQDLQTVMETNFILLNESQQIKVMLWDSFTFGVGVIKTIWDQSLDDGYGNAKFIRCDPWCIYPDPRAKTQEEMEYIIEVRKMTLSEIERRWPKSSVLVEASGGLNDNIDERSTTTSPGGNKNPMANPGPLPSGNGNYGAPTRGPSFPDTTEAVVYEFWIKENHSYTEEIDGAPQEFVEAKWKCIVIANNQILMEEWAEDLWTYGTHPYDLYIPEDIGEIFAVPIVDHLAQPQIYINRLLGAMQGNAELCGNPVLVEAANTGIERTAIVNRPGQRLRLSGPAAMQSKPEWMVPPPMPSVVQGLVDFWIQRIENISGLGAAVKGGVNGAPSRTPEGVVSTIQEAAFVRIRSMLGNMEATLLSVSRKLADLIIENYTEKRIIAIVGQTGTQTSLVLKPRHFNVPSSKGETPLKYSLLIQAGSSMPTSRQARVAEADQAYALGIIDRQAWFEAHSYPNWQPILTRINSQIAQGIFNPPGARQRAMH